MTPVGRYRRAAPTSLLSSTPVPLPFPRTVELRNRGLFHTTYKLFMAALLLQTSGVALLCAAYGRYAHDGIGLPKSKLAGTWRHAAHEGTAVLSGCVPLT